MLHYSLMNFGVRVDEVRKKARLQPGFFFEWGFDSLDLTILSFYYLTFCFYTSF